MMNKTRLSLVLLLVSLVVSTFAYERSTYYASANGKKGAELKTALYNIIKSPDVTSYDGLIEAYHKTDTRADGKIRDWYSNVTNYTWSDRNGNSAEGAGWNREHSVPQSWFSKGSPMRSDIVHVVPTDCYVNNRRSNYPLGEVGTITYQSKNAYSKLGSSRTNGYSGTVFEPNDEIKGDMARIYFYMATCYEDKITSWGNNVFSSQKYPGLEQWVTTMMMRWSKDDPLDAIEVARNEAVEDVQKNRNPFVDFPGLEQYIWGSYKDVPFNAQNYRNPYNDGTLETPTALFAEQMKTMEVGETYYQPLETNSDGEVTFESSNTAVATVDAKTGWVRAIAAGTATISAFVSQTDAYASTVASYTVYVTDGDDPGPGPTPEPMGDTYVKVTSAPADWTGTYLIVYEPDGLALNGGDVADRNYISVEIEDEVIHVNSQTEAAEFSIQRKSGGYSIQGRDGNFIGHDTGSKNVLNVSSQDDFTNSISIASGNAIIECNSYQLFYNKSANLFRYYKSGQQPVALYRRTAATGIELVDSGDKEGADDMAIYDLTGRRVHRITRPGLYIIRGKKTYMR